MDMKQSEELDDLFYKLAYHDLKRAYHSGKWRDCLQEAMEKFQEEYSDLHKGDVLNGIERLLRLSSALETRGLPQKACQ